MSLGGTMNNVLGTAHGRLRRFAVIALLLGLAGCAAEVGAPNLAPASLDEAEDTLRHIDAMLDANPEDEEAWEMLEVLQPRLDELNHLVARIELAPGHTVRFYEVEPGMIGVSETSPKGEQPVLNDEEVMGMAVTDLYEHLALERAPSSLVAAQEREDALAQVEEELLVEDLTLEELGELEQQVPTEVGSVQSALTSSQGPYFQNNLCFTRGDFRGCYPNSGGNVFAQANAKTSFFTVAPYRGNVSVRFRYEGVTQFTDAVFSGQVRSFWWHSSSYRQHPSWWIGFNPRRYHRRTHRWEVRNASGDGFHWTHAFKWDCIHADCHGFPR